MTFQNKLGTPVLVKMLSVLVKTPHLRCLSGSPGGRREDQRGDGRTPEQSHQRACRQPQRCDGERMRASHLEAMASNLMGMASNLLAVFCVML